MSSISRSLSPPLELEIQTNQILVAESPSDVHKSNLKHLDHFSHEHPLILYEEGNDDVRVGVQEIICLICGDSVSNDGPIYSCSSSNTACDFFLHKSCAEVPEEIQSVFHPQHVLFLSAADLRSCFCKICQENRLSRPYNYECVDCEFRIHIDCALLYNMQEPTRHEHSLIHLKPALFTCDACGIEEETKCVSRVCTTCQLQVHKKCASSFPLTVKLIVHEHELSLYFSKSVDDFPNDYECMICDREMNGVLCFYYCVDCEETVAHVTCALLIDLRDEYDYEALLELENNNHQYTTTTFAIGPIETTKEISHTGQNATDELRHFSHPQHCLILSNDPKVNEFCDGCAMPISVPYYTCADDQCDFLLHKECFKLPHKIQHPFHNHLLTLQAKAVDSSDENSFGIFRCHYCHVLCNGFTYTCAKCNIFIDIGCGLLTYAIFRESRDFPLYYQYDKAKAKCSACGLDCFSIFACKECDVNLDYRCASLPDTISHDCPKPECCIRPFKLTYGSVDDGSGEYYCDVCEERRGQNHWFYYCEYCDYSSHPQCVLAEDRIKFGRTYLSKCHPHSLTLVKQAKAKGKGHPPCATCGDPCKGVAVLFCTECNIYIHHRRKCCGPCWIDL